MPTTPSGLSAGEDPLAIQFPAACSAGVLALLISLCPGSLCAATEAESERRNQDQAEWIRIQLQKDMMYGSDDFFSEDTDLGYIDGVAPSPPPVVIAPTPAPLPTVETPTSEHPSSTTSNPQPSPVVETPPVEAPPDVEPPPEEEPPPV